MIRSVSTVTDWGMSRISCCPLPMVVVVARSDVASFSFVPVTSTPGRVSAATSVGFGPAILRVFGGLLAVADLGERREAAQSEAGSERAKRQDRRFRRNPRVGR